MQGAGARPRSGGGSAGGGRGSSAAAASSRRRVERDYDDDDYDDDRGAARRRSAPRGRGPPPKSSKRASAGSGSSSSSRSRKDGGSSRSSRPPARSSASRSRGGPPRRRDYDDEDDYSYDDDDYGRGSSRQYRRGALVPSGRGSASRNTPSILSEVASQLRNKAAAAREEAQGKLVEWRKIAKCKTSSQYERYMLQLTWPDDNAVEDSFISDVIHYLDTSDDYYGVTDKKNPFRRTLLKLYKRMRERDHRTVIKAMFILHQLAHGLNPEAATRLAQHTKRIRREYDPKSPREKFFSVDRVVDVSPVGEPFVSFIEAYYGFTLKRIQFAEGGLKRVSEALTDEATSDKAAIKLLARTSAVIEASIQCRLTKDLLGPLTASVMDFLAVDAAEMWQVFAEGVIALCSSSASSEVSNDVKMEFLRKAISTQDALESYLLKSRKMIWGKKKGKGASLGLRLDLEELTAAIEGAAQPVEDDEDEDEDVPQQRAEDEAEWEVGAEGGVTGGDRQSEGEEEDAADEVEEEEEQEKQQPQADDEEVEEEEEEAPGQDEYDDEEYEEESGDEELEAGDDEEEDEYY